MTRPMTKQDKLRRFLLIYGWLAIALSVLAGATLIYSLFILVLYAQLNVFFFLEELEFVVTLLFGLALEIILAWASFSNRRRLVAKDQVLMWPYVLVLVFIVFNLLVALLTQEWLLLFMQSIRGLLTVFLLKGLKAAKAEQLS